jgi:tetratricopeptide (TPR) repeat protein
MRKIILLFVGILLSINIFSSELDDYKKAESLILQNKTPQAIKILKSLYKSSKNSTILTGVILHLADLSIDAEISAKYYKELYKKYPKSKETTIALIRLGQYYYASKAYKLSKSYFLKVLKRPISPFLKQKALYWLAKSYTMGEQYDSAIIYFNKIIEEDTLSPYYRLSKNAINDIDKINNHRKQPVINEIVIDTTYKYGIQIGTFNNRNNALNLESQFSKKGYNVYIVNIKSDEKISYKVIIGRFSKKENAKDYLNIFKKAEGISCWVVKLNY